MLLLWQEKTKRVGLPLLFWRGNTSSVAYGLSCSTGTYTVVGQQATTTYITPVNLTLTASTGSYTATGKTATLNTGHKLSLSKGTYSYSGLSSTLTKVTASTSKTKGGQLDRQEYNTNKTKKTRLHKKLLQDDEEVLALILAGIIK
jgi:hypothetical protein